MLQWQSTTDDNLGPLSSGFYGNDVQVALQFYEPDWSLDTSDGYISSGGYASDDISASINDGAVPFVGDAGTELIFDSHWKLAEWHAFAGLYNSDSWQGSFGSSSHTGAQLTLRYVDPSSPTWYVDPFHLTDIYTGYLESITVSGNGISLTQTFSPPSSHVVSEASGLPLVVLGLLPLFLRRWLFKQHY